jgi:phosphohistidine phosphatase SixA
LHDRKPHQVRLRSDAMDGLATIRNHASISDGARPSMQRALASRVGRLLLCASTLLALASAHADDEKVWAALKEGGKVILLRHTHVVIREGIGHLAPGNCAAEVNLSARGVEQAKRLRQQFRARGIAIGEVLTSPYCRCKDTGMLVFGRATPVRYLVPPGVVSERQAASNSKRTLSEILRYRGRSNLVMITHSLNIEDQVLDSPHMGEFYVLQPNGADFAVLGTIDLFGD